MDIVIICNGLGNQMSQYAFYMKKKSIDESTRFIYDINSLHDHNGYELNTVFGISYKDIFINRVLNTIFRILGMKKFPVITKPLIKFLNIMGMSIVRENPNYDYNVDHLKPSRGIRFFYGGWHSEKYFDTIKEGVLEVFKFKISEGDEKINKVLADIRSTNSVSMHVRRGDFLVGTNMSMFGAVCSKEYFSAAIEKINSKVDKPHFFVFSNDVSWVKENFQLENLTVVDFNKGADSWKDMYLMSNCKYNINSNSSFSWWGSWLNSYRDKLVVVPKFFINNVDTKDIYPENWLQLNDY